EPIAGVSFLRAIREADEQIRFRAEIVKVSGDARRLLDLHGALPVDLDVHEGNEGVRDIAIIEAPGTQGLGKIAAAIRRVRHTVANTVQLLAAHGAGGISELAR